MRCLLFFCISFIQISAHSQSIDSVYIELKRQNVKHPEIVLAQSIEETGWYKCKNCSLNRNNIFGFRYKKKYLEFNNWKESVTYYKNWQNRHYVQENHKNYYDFLVYKHYASNPIYTKNVKKIEKTIINMKLWD
jgi:hypothetical protein